MSFTSWLKKVGEDVKKGLDYILPIAETAGQIAIAEFAPGLGPLFNNTVHAVAVAEQNAVALGQTAAGPSKLAAVVGIAGGLIKQGLEDAGKSADILAVQNYINSVVTILNAIPAPAAVTKVTP